VTRWHGGDHSALKVRKNRTGQHRWSAAGETVDLVRVLARQMLRAYFDGRPLRNVVDWERGY
jgi:hypothetical protein